MRKIEYVVISWLRIYHESTADKIHTWVGMLACNIVAKNNKNWMMRRKRWTGNVHTHIRQTHSRPRQCLPVVVVDVDCGHVKKSWIFRRDTIFYVLDSLLWYLQEKFEKRLHCCSFLFIRFSSEEEDIQIIRDDFNVKLVCESCQAKKIFIVSCNMSFSYWI